MSATLLRSVRRIGTRGEPVDVLVREGRITSVTPAGGDVTGTLDEADTALEVVDLDGVWIGPGLWDHHVHFDQWSLVRMRVDVSAEPSAAATAAALGAAAAARSGGGSGSRAGGLLVGFGFRDGLWPDTPDRALLDRAAPDLPVVVVSADLHAVWCSTAALVRLGLAGHPTGVLREQQAFDVSTAISRVPEHELDEYAEGAADAAAARGVVGIVDLEMSFGLDRWRRRIRAGTDQLRVRSGVYPDELDAVLSRGLRTGNVVEGTHGLLAMGPFKVITDGSLNTRTAAVDEPYAGLSGDDAHGTLAFAADEVVRMVRRAVEGGLVPAVHAIGDRANALALDVFEQVGTRGTIEHAQLLRPADVERFARLGVTASVQPEHAMDDRDVADHFWEGRTDRAFVFRSLVAAGARLQLGSDAPVAPLDPWLSMAAAVGRDRDGREAWRPEQRLDPVTAWTASTDGRASVAVGDVADLVLVADDPLAASSAELRRTEVLGTAIAGRWTHREW